MDEQQFAAGAAVNLVHLVPLCLPGTAMITARAWHQLPARRYGRDLHGVGMAGVRCRPVADPRHGLHLERRRVRCWRWDGRRGGWAT